MVEDRERDWLSEDHGGWLAEHGRGCVFVSAGRVLCVVPAVSGGAHSLGVAELGPLTGNASGILNMAIVGGAILPLIQGAIADHIGIHHAFFVPVICYLYILFYALNGSKPNSERYVSAYN